MPKPTRRDFLLGSAALLTSAFASAQPARALVVMTNSSGFAVCREVAERALGREQPAFKWLMG